MAYARVLAAHWARFHPDTPFYVLLLDGDKAAVDREGFELLGCDDLDISAEELEIRRGIYNPWELATSLKVELLRTLIADGSDAVVFVDPDHGVYGPLDDVAAAAAEHGIALSPHLLRPPPADGFYPNELDILKFGIFNGGFLAVGPSAAPFLEWWSGHVRRDCLDERSGGLHADQTWLQSVPQYFPFTILTDPTLHVAHWNIHERDLEFVDGRYLVAGTPLRSFHFSQFDPERPDELCSWLPLTRYRITRSRNPAVFQLLREYAGEVVTAGYVEDRATGYRYATSASGRPLGKWERAVYREAVLAAEARGSALPPSPFEPARAADFEALVGSRASWPSLSPQARERLERLRPAGAPRTAGGRAARRLRRAAGYALTGRLAGRSLDSSIPTRITSDLVRLEYRRSE